MYYAIAILYDSNRKVTFILVRDNGEYYFLVKKDHEEEVQKTQTKRCN
jgi:hypothetical protein